MAADPSSSNINNIKAFLACVASSKRAPAKTAGVEEDITLLDDEGLKVAMKSAKELAVSGKWNPLYFPARIMVLEALVDEFKQKGLRTNGLLATQHKDLTPPPTFFAIPVEDNNSPPSIDLTIDAINKTLGV